MPSLIIYYDILKNQNSIVNKIIHNTDDFKNYCIQLFNFINKQYLSSNINNNNTKLTYQQNDNIFTINKEDTVIREGWIYNSSNTIITPIYKFKITEINNEFTEYLNKQEETLNDLILLNNSLEKTIDYFFEKFPSKTLNNNKISFNFTEGLIENYLNEDIDSNNSYNNDFTPISTGSGSLHPTESGSLHPTGSGSVQTISQDYLDKTHTIHQQYQNPTSKSNAEYLLPPIDTESDESLESFINNYSLNYSNSYNYSHLNDFKYPICYFYNNTTNIYTLSQPSQVYSPFIDKINYSLHGYSTTNKNNKNSFNHSYNKKPIASTKINSIDSIRQGILSSTKQDLSFIDELKEKLHQKFKNS